MRMVPRRFSTHILSGQSRKMSVFRNWRNWVGVELRSPAVTAVPVAFKAIDYVRQLITSTIRVRVNHSCGLHVHVGMAGERFPLGAMKRIVSLAWAAEHLLYALHHPWRRANASAPSLRHMSNLALVNAGEKAQDHLRKFAHCTKEIDEYIASDVRHGEEPISWREANRDEKYVQGFAQTRQAGHYEPFWGDLTPIPPEPKGKNDMNPKDELIARVVESMRRMKFAQPQNKAEEDRSRERKIPRILTPRYTYEELEAMSKALDAMFISRNYFDKENREYFEDPGVFEGVGPIFGSSSSCRIASLVDPGDRGYISTAAYSCADFRYKNSKRTIEFRGSEGTLSPWAVDWAKICVGFVRFAMHAPLVDYMEVLEKCAMSTKEDGIYDVIDLIDDLGLPAQAQAAEKRIEERKEAWKLQFAKSEKPTE
ncbi:uncharacterized protein F4822DRAFT_421109 [Hypoxylon trugodes]|uniref:uncharacterized protein n=1 Tax=Hypoxylon trugodes TaxID=326681 RepID=UPI00218D45A6|nr:uncharacterized protein F4822DRAFT_421109 [Hypoxylon trugodes]KAI1383599.1 hypothetical protein F4822DRAFT_421109 [Hypoxylon trugodes]